jgi:hypothetical protein
MPGSFTFCMFQVSIGCAEVPDFDGAEGFDVPYRRNLMFVV